MFLALGDLEPSVRYSLFGLANVLLFVWGRFIVAPARVGMTRFILSMPLFFLCVFISYLFTFGNEAEEALVMHISSNYLWLTIWKCAGLCWNRGQLTKAYHTGSLAAFAVAMLLPVNVAYNETRVNEEKKTDGDVKKPDNITDPFEDVRFSVIKLKGRELVKELVTSFISIIIQWVLCIFLTLQCLKFEEGTYIRSIFISWICMFFLSIFQDLNTMVSVATLRLKLAKNFDRPYLATSIAEFWSTRWNMVMHAQLREVVYEPILEGRFVASPRYFEKPRAPIARRVVAVSSVFFASGIIHALLLMQQCQSARFPYRYIVFFCFSALFVMTEKLTKRFLQRYSYYKQFVKSIPYPLALVYMHVVMITLAHFFFWPDVTDYGLTQKNIEGVLSVTPGFLLK